MNIQNQKQAYSLAVTGGKGGTGKTLIATNLAVKFAQEGYKILLIDSDVENPNTNILLGKELIDENVEKIPISIFLPKFDPTLCTRCGKCRDACYRHAILQFIDQSPSVMEHMCSGCQTCFRVCPTNAISRIDRVIGYQYFVENVSNNLDLLIGELNPSEAVSVLIVEEILDFAKKMQQQKQYDLIIVDTSPGAHCDVEKSLGESNSIICVTEPTPFGEHDLERILKLIQIVGKEASVIINRSTLTEYKQPILNMMELYNSKLLGEIPLDRIVIEDYARGIPFSTDERNFPAKSSFNSIFEQIFSQLKSEKILSERNNHE